MKRLSNQKSIALITSIAILLLMTMAAGCSKYAKTVVFSKPAIRSRAVLYTPWNSTKKVCVLPFENISKESDADLKVMEIFLTELFSSRIFEDIVDPIQANAALLGMRIRNTNSLDKETIKALGDRLGVQYLILGTVTDYDYGKAKGSSSQVGLSTRMIDVNTGNILWTGNCYQNGATSMGRIFGFTNGPNPSELSKAICQTIISSLKSQIKKNGRGRSSLKAQQETRPQKTKIVTMDNSLEKRR